MSTMIIPRYSLIAVRSQHSPLYGGSPLTASSAVHKVIRQHFEGAAQEEFIAIHLDAKHAPIGYQVVSVGSLTLSIVHPREAFKMACVLNACAIIFAHNHPSGDPTPSTEDRVLTRRLVECGELLGIRVLDHVVIGEDCYASFADQGWLNG